MSASDSYVYDMSMKSEKLGEQFTQKDYLWISDTNLGSYNGTIVFDSSSLSNSGRWLSWSEAYIVVPIIMAYKSTEDISANDLNSPFVLSAKCGWHQLIDSLEVQFMNTSVSQVYPFTNILTSYKMLTSFSQDGLAKYGTLLNFWPDSFASYGYTAAKSVNGVGSNNNNIVDFVAYKFNAASYSYRPANEGLKKRLFASNMQVGLVNSYMEFMPSASAATLGKSVFRTDGGAGAARQYYTSSLAVIRLADVCDFFAQMPLARGAFMKITINTNTASTTLTATKATSIIDVLAIGDLNVRGRTNPILVSSAQTTNPTSYPVTGVADSDILCEYAIAKTVAMPVQLTHPTLQNCRLYVPAYQMTPEYEQQYLSASPVKTITYHDAYNYVISPGAPAGDVVSFSTLLTNGIIDPQYLVVVPIARTPLAGMTALTSPFSSEPGTTSPVGISQFQVQLSGRNIFNENQNYDFQSFSTEFTAINSLNGGKSTEITSGLIGYDEWNSIYRYYVADLSRGQESDSYTPKSVLVSGTCLGPIQCELYAFVVYRRTLSFRTEDSAIIQL